MNLHNAEFVRSVTAVADCPKDGLPQIAFAGKSNVGKSSVINKLLLRKNFARVGVQFHRCPAEAGAVVQFFLINGRACSVGHGHPPTVGDARVHPQRHRVPLQGHGFGQGRVGGIQRALRRGKAAQVRKAYHSSRRRQRQHGQQLFSLPLGLGGRYCGGCRLLRLAFGGSMGISAGEYAKGERPPHEVSVLRSVFM